MELSEKGKSFQRHLRSVSIKLCRVFQAMIFKNCRKQLEDVQHIFLFPCIFHLKKTHTHKQTLVVLQNTRRENVEEEIN